MLTLRSAVAVSAVLVGAAAAQASHTPTPAQVVVAGSLQSELGCPDDWQPGCATTALAFDATDGVFQGAFALPAGSFEYKAALNGSWDENYGANATPNGANIPLNLGAPRSVKFYYSHETHWVADNATKVIAVAPGSFQSELGCPGDWQPDCLRSWLQDPDGDGIYTFRTNVLPAGSYEVKVAINESWDENYGAGGAPGGANIPFTVTSDCAEVVFTYDPATHVLAVTESGGGGPQPTSVTIAGSLQSELGCPSDWQPECAASHLALDPTDDVWQGSFDLPAGNWEYKAALDDTWDENYGANAILNGPNIPLNLAAARRVKFYYSHQTHWVADSVGKVIAVAPGSFQSELGCPGDWQPDCLRSWLQDPDGDGIYTFRTSVLPAGDYEVKVAINESWDENYGEGGVPGGANIAFTVPSSCKEMLFRYDPATHALTVSSEGAPPGDLRRARAQWLTADTVAWNLTGFDPAWTVELQYDPTGGLRLEPSGVSGGTVIPLSYDPAGLSAELRARFPHLAGYAAFKLPASRLSEVKEALKSQLAVSAKAADGTLLDATSLQIPGALDDLYRYDGPLGVTFANGRPTLRVWAPTARSVKLHLYATSDAASPEKILDMTGDAATGVWRVDGASSWSGRFYAYEVEVFVRATGAVERNLVTDPYSVGLSQNSRRSQIVDLASREWMPPGWRNLEKPRLRAPEDIVLYELSVRDFSASDPSVPEPSRGTFRAFALDSHGTRHLRALARAGLTHVHVLPAFDIASIDEDKSQWKDPGDLSGFAPDSDQQQAAVRAVADADAYNWGYDPWHYTVPDGAYATRPDGAHRVLEFREMVQGLSRLGLRVVMDVVYNHTTASGQNAKSVLDRVVPGYYHRLDAQGEVEHSTCCENTASEHRMMEKLLVDSVLTWAKQYKVDGFRFDLMGHHMKRNMVALREALDALTPQRDGVDGRKVYLYGEGWNFGEVANGARGENATQLNMAGTGIGTFNDRLRDGARGGGPFSGLQEQGFLTGLAVDPNGTNQGSPSEQRDRLLQYIGLDPRGSDRQPRRLHLRGPARQHGAGPGRRLQRAARRLHGRPPGGHQLRRGPRQRDAVRRDPAQGARLRHPGRARAHAEPGHEPPPLRPGRAVPPRRGGAPALEIPRPEQLQLRRLVQPPRLHGARRQLGGGAAAGAGQRGRLAGDAPAPRQSRAPADERGHQEREGAPRRDARHPRQLPALPPAHGRGGARAAALLQHRAEPGAGAHRLLPLRRGRERQVLAGRRRPRPMHRAVRAGRGAVERRPRRGDPRRARAGLATPATALGPEGFGRSRRAHRALRPLVRDVHGAGPDGGGVRGLER